MKLVKQIGYKLIVTLCVVMTFCCFIASAPVEASKVTTGEFYYSGTTQGTYTVNKGFLEKLIDALGQILDFLFGLATMGIRIVFVGWTVLLERCLTWILEGATGEELNIDNASSTAMTPPDEYITLEAIFFNRVPLLDINVFNLDPRDDVSPLGEELNPTSHIIIDFQNGVKSERILVQGEKNNFFGEAPAGGAGAPNESLIVILKKSIATWYYIFRTISIMIMLVLLVFIGVKIAIQSSTTDKALYKRVLMDWVVGMILVFSIHYIMLFIIQFNEILVEKILDFKEAAEQLKIYEYGLESRAQDPVTTEEMEMSIYQQVRSRAYDARMSVGFTGMIMYMVLVFYAWKYTFIYLKRYLTIAILVIVAPLVAVTYAFNKVQSGKSQIFTGWLKEFFFMVMLQSIHAIMYVVFVDSALALSLTSVAGMIMAFICMHFVGNAEKIFRNIFNIQGALTNDIADGGGLRQLAQSFKAAATTMGVMTVGKKFAKGTARLLSKPVRAAGNYGFGKVMQIRANREYKRKGYSLEDSRELIENDRDLEDAERLEKRRKGNIAYALAIDTFDTIKHPFSKEKRKGKIKEKENELAEWKKLKGSKFIDENGEEVEIDDEFIEEKENELAEMKEINKHQLRWAKHTLAAKTRDRWRNILDPYQYVELGEDGKYHAVKNEHKKGVFAKKTDGVGKRFFAHFQADDEMKKALKVQLSMIGHQITGFMGILVGLPTLIAEPKLGAALLYQGIQSSNKVYGKSQDFKSVKLVPPGQKFTLKGFAGASEQTIAVTALELAREQITENEQDNIQHYKSVINCVKRKQCGGNLSLKSSGSPTYRYSTFKASGFSVSRISNYKAAYLASRTISKKVNKKAEQAQIKSTEDFLELLADRYNEMEAEKNKAAFSNLYLSITAKQEEAVDNMSMEEVQRELEYPEEIVVVKQADGTVKLSGDLETTIIDNAIIESAQKAGIIDIGELELSDQNVEQIASVIVKELREKKILGKDVDVSTVIDNIEEKIKDRQAVLAKEGTAPVEERIADQAIVSVMKEENITDPSQVDSEAVLEKYEEIYSTIIGETTKQSTSVTDQMQGQKPKTEKRTPIIEEIIQNKTVTEDIIDTDDTETVDTKVADRATAEKIIEARTEHLTKKAKRTTKSEELRSELKRKKVAQLDATILETQEILESSSEVETISTTPTIETVSEDTRKTDDVLRLLAVQTEMHKSYELVSANRKAREKKLKAFKTELFEDDGSIRRDTAPDGSRQVVLRDGTKVSASPRGTGERKKTDGSSSVTTSSSDGSRRIEDVLLDLKRGRK